MNYHKRVFIIFIFFTRNKAETREISGFGCLEMFRLPLGQTSEELPRMEH